MATAWRMQPFLREKVDRARRLLAESEQHRGSAELQAFEEEQELLEKVHATFLQADGSRREGVSRREKQEVGGDSVVGWPRARAQRLHGMSSVYARSGLGRPCH